MQKSLFTLVAISALMGTAQAQSSIALYGLIDTGVNYVSEANQNDFFNAKNGRVYAISNGVMQESRWGLRGVEELDSRLKAIFTLEGGLDVNTGQVMQRGRLFGRQAFVGLGGDFGAITIGRQNDSINDFVSPLASSNRGGGSFAAQPGDFNNVNGSYRIDNALKYTSANYDGLTFGGLYSLGGASGRFSKDWIWSTGANFTRGPLAIGAAFLKAKNPNASFFGNDPTFEGPRNQIASVVTRGFGTSADSMQIATAGATFAFGLFTAGATYSNVQFKDVIEQNIDLTKSKGILNSVEASLAHQFSPALSGIFSMSYTKSNSVKGKKGARYKQINAGLDYALSKRTDVYMLVVGQNASGANSLNINAIAEINGFSPSLTGRQRAARIGMRHVF